MHPNVSALVCVAARAPDAGEDYTALAKTFPRPSVTAGIVFDGDEGASAKPRCRHCPTIISWDRGQRSISLTIPPSGWPIGRGPVATTIRECLTVVESGEAVVIFGERLEHYYSNPAIRYTEIDVPPVGTAFVRGRADRRRATQDLEECRRPSRRSRLTPCGQ
jgi:hypothetical protein